MRGQARRKIKSPGSPGRKFVVLFWGGFFVVVVFFFFLMFIPKITCFGRCSFLSFLHVPPPSPWLFWQGCSGKQQLLTPLPRACTAGCVRFLCRWPWELTEMVLGWGTGDSASRSADVPPSEVAGFKKLQLCRTRSNELCWPGRVHGQGLPTTGLMAGGKLLLAQNTESLLSSAPGKAASHTLALRKQMDANSPRTAPASSSLSPPHHFPFLRVCWGALQKDGVSINVLHVAERKI